MDPPTASEVVGLVANGVISLGLYWAYKRDQRDIDQIKGAQHFNVGTELKDFLQKCPSNSIAYASVSGYVEPTDIPLKSMYEKSISGVLQRLTLKEHRAKRTQGFWHDDYRVIRNSINIVPFQLADRKSDAIVTVKVNQPLESWSLLDNLRLTYAKYEPSSSSFFEKSVDRMFGEVTKGFQEKERMLVVGTKLLSVGTVVLQNNQLEMGPPPEGYSYYLTPLSKQDLIKSIQDSQRFYPYVLAVSVLSGLLYGGWVCLRMYRNRIHQQEIQRQIEELQRARREGREPSGDDAQLCVVCLENPREIVILNCGHICSCHACYEQIPEPKMCPVCRQPIIRIVAIYNA